MNRWLKFSGHTMGTPGRDIFEVIKLFRGIGYDGIEVRIAKDGQIDSESITGNEAKSILRAAKNESMEFSCLTSYYQNLVADNLRDDVIKNLKRVVEIADLLECRLIRMYGCVEPYTQKNISFNDFWSLTVSGLQEVALYAAKYGIGICIETHIGSLTMSVRDTIRLLDDVNMHNVGMLFDYAWVEIAGVEKGAEAVRAAARYIKHVHVKDWALESRIPLVKRSCLMGEGTVRWEEVLSELKKIGYTGYISDEYEKFWHPDELPEPEIGMKHNLEYVKKRLL